MNDLYDHADAQLFAQRRTEIKEKLRSAKNARAAAQVAQQDMDTSKPREGRSEAEVVTEATGIISSGRVNDGHIWTIVDETTPWVAEVLAYYEATNQQEKAANPAHTFH